MKTPSRPLAWRSVALLVATLVTLYAAPLGAQDDPLHSPACTAASARLEQTLADASAKRAGARERLPQDRAEALETCLGRQSEAARRSGAPATPAVVPAPVMTPPPEPVRRPALQAPAASAPPPVEIPRPRPVALCDATGCWDSEGRRLEQMGPLLLGPGGPCVRQGNLVHCP